MSKPALKVISNKGPDQEVRINPAALISLMRPRIEKFMADKKAKADAAAANSGD